MRKVIFVIGATASGKTYFIDQNYAGRDFDILNVYDYQQRAYTEAGFRESIPFGEEFRCLLKAQNMLLEDIVARLQAGRDVVVEQTFYKAKRRIAYIERIREAVEASIEFYVMCPSDSQWEKNIENRKLDGRFEAFKRNMEDFEFPNPAEGIDQIYEVVDGIITLRMDEPKPEIMERAKEELAKEAERLKAEDDKRRRKKELLESMETRPFWHYCEVCGKKEFVTAQEADDSGWDYPPRRGSFGVLSPRTCGNCCMVGTLYMKILAPGRLPVVLESELTPEELVTWRRIKGEPESLLKESPTQ